MKVMILNGSPRRNWNTGLMLQAVQKGAESAGAETEYVDLYSLNYTGCRGCLLCKRKGMEPCRCYWKDDLSEIIDKIFAADALVIGSPVYLGSVTSQVRALMERLEFCSLSYNDYANYFTGRVDVGVILTMNAKRDTYENLYRDSFREQMKPFLRLNGDMEIYPCCDTLQVQDYSKYEMARFQEEHKKQMRETLFQEDLEAAFRMGVRLGTPTEKSR